MPPEPLYAKNMGLQGFLDGYLTLDALAGLNYGLVVVYVIKQKNVLEESKIAKIVISTGIFAGILLFVVYKNRIISIYQAIQYFLFHFLLIL